MLSATARKIVAALQMILGWEWLMSGCNKLFSGTFPQGLADALGEGVKGNPNDWYVGFLQNVVLPNSIFFGYLIQWTEITIGIVLLGGAALLLTKPRLPGEPMWLILILSELGCLSKMDDQIEPRERGSMRAVSGCLYTRQRTRNRRRSKLALPNTIRF